MSDKESKRKKEEELSRKLIESLDKILSTGDWEASLFLKANKKRLEGLRSEAQTVLDDLTAEKEKENLPHLKQMDRPGYKLVYISIYQADAGNLAKWQSTIRALEKHVVSRPVYSEEAHVKTLIRNKPDPNKEGYVVAHVKESDFVKPYLGAPMHDRFDHPLITLKEHAFQLENMIKFVHTERQYYYVSEKGLSLIQP